MIIYRVLSALLSYPEQELIDALPEIEAVLAPTPRIRAQLGPLIEHLRTTKLIRLQEEYVAEFDRSRRQSRHSKCRPEPVVEPDLPNIESPLVEMPESFKRCLCVVKQEHPVRRNEYVIEENHRILLIESVG